MRPINPIHVTGLSTAEARKRLLESGPNRIFVPERISFFGIARHEITEPMILLLLVVGFFYSIWGNLADALTIFGIILLLVSAEVYNEYRAKKAISSLEKITAPKVKLLRDGRIAEIPAEEIVPGDLLLLSVGAEIAADAEIIDGLGLQCDESPLTGESFPREKKNGDTAYAGTVVLAGEGRAEVVAVGKGTRLGKVAASLHAIEHPRTPLQLAMKSLVRKLVFVAAFFSLFIPVIGIMRGLDIRTMILTGLSLSFATIPEELPIIITMVLGLGSYVLSKNNFLVKKLHAAETLGNATVIVTDKTGTVTEGRMKIVALYPPDGQRDILAAALGSLSDVVLSPLEREIRKRAEESGVGNAASRKLRQRNLGADDKKTKSVIRTNGRHYEMFLGGAPEEVFMACRGVAEDVKSELKEETSRGRRVIAVSSRKLLPGEERLAFTDLEKDMDFIGLIVFEDPPRMGVRETVAEAGNAGIRTIMVTGDHPLTAGFIARQTGISSDSVMEGKDLDVLTDEELRGTVRNVAVYARTTPEHKYRIVRALQENGEVVAVTGDGINDVLALKGADIGIAMGIRGTDVAKDAAEVVLADDNYITITKGIFEGRKFYDNLQKGISYYLSVKVALILIFMLPVTMGIPMPFSPIQIIILELFMDLAASAGFVAEPKERDIYSRPPRGRDQEVLTGGVVRDIFMNAAALFSSVMLAYFYARSQNLSFGQIQTFAFSAWIFGHIALAFVSRSRREFISAIGVFTNKIINVWAVAALVFLAAGIYLPILQSRLNLARISATQLLSIALVTLCIIGLREAMKFSRVPV
jgi:Ca2+-transporting ATPase